MEGDGEGSGSNAILYTNILLSKEMVHTIVVNNWFEPNDSGRVMDNVSTACLTILAMTVGGSMLAGLSGIV